MTPVNPAIPAEVVGEQRKAVVMSYRPMDNKNWFLKHPTGSFKNLWAMGASLDFASFFRRQPGFEMGSRQVPQQ